VPHFDLTRSELSFGAALTALVREVEDDLYVTERGLKINTFAEMLDGVSAPVLAAAVAGARPPSLRLLEECARVLRVRPEYFREYRDRSLRAA
jgi:Helix-turn-helix